MPLPYNFLKKLSQHGKEENEYNKENNRRSWIIAYNPIQKSIGQFYRCL